MPELKKNSIHTITIDRYASDGQGIGRLDGMAVFVRGALRGETCQVSLMKVGKSCAWARVVKILEKSPARIPSDCPHFPICGGCTLRHMTFSALVGWTCPSARCMEPRTPSATGTRRRSR